MLPRAPTLAGLWLIAACTPLVAAQLPSSRPAAAVLPLQNQAGHLSAGKALHQGVERELELRFNLPSIFFSKGNCLPQEQLSEE